MKLIMASFNLNDLNSKNMLNLLMNQMNAMKTQSINVNSNMPVIQSQTGLNNFNEQRMQALLYQLRVQPYQNQNLQNTFQRILANIQLQQILNNPSLLNYLYINQQNTIDPAYVTQPVNQINNFNLNVLDGVLKHNQSLCQINTLEINRIENNQPDLNKTRDESQSSKDKENSIIEINELNQNFENSDNEDSCYSNKKRRRNAKWNLSKKVDTKKNCKNKKEDKINYGLIIKKTTKKTTLKLRANELLQDSFLAILDKSEKFKINNLEDLINPSSLENPQNFMKIHFPVPYRYLRKNEVKFHLAKSTLDKSHDIFIKFPYEAPEVFSNDNLPKKVFSPLENSEEDCILFILFYF